ncbi:MAG: sugar ABC transporter permease [Candidatus Hydrogenedentes bacterium]|nr:sugar ABC transporter permease [Candidatus Hydrogenedentota bacterium]
MDLRSVSAWTTGYALLAAVLVGLVAHKALLRLADRLLEAIDSAIERIRAPRTRSAVAAFLLLSPALAILGLFGVVPLVYAVRISLFDTRRDIFVGAGNYARAWGDPEFWRSLSVTLYYALGTIPLTLAISFCVAWLLHRAARGRGFLRTAYFLPYVTSAVAAATVWRVLLRPRSGFVNVMLDAIGLPMQDWLLEQRGVLHILTQGWIPPGVGPSLALCCIMAFDIWHASGFTIVIFLAGLTAIPRELMEAAVLDGAGPLQVLRRVVLPLLSPTIFFLAVVSGIRAFQSFNSFYALTNTSRGADTQNLVIYIFAQLYESQRYGYGAAVATLLCAAIVALTIIQWRYVGRRVHYE